MTRFEQPADDPYSALDHMDGLGETLAAMTPEQRREAVEKDTTIEPAPYQDRASRHVSFWVALGLGLAIIGCLLWAAVTVP